MVTASFVTAPPLHYFEVTAKSLHFILFIRLEFLTKYILKNKLTIVFITINVSKIKFN